MQDNEENPTGRPDNAMIQLFSVLERVELEEFIMRYAVSHPEIRQALFAYFIPNAEDNKQELDMELYQLEIEDTCDESSFWRFHNRAQLFCEKKAWADAASLALQALRSLGIIYGESGYMYDEDGCMAGVCRALAELILRIVRCEEVSGELKTAILEEVRNCNQITAFHDYVLLDINQFVLRLSPFVLSVEETFSMCDNALTEHLCTMEQAVLYKSDALYAHGRTNEAKALLNENSAYPKVREALINLLQETGCEQELLDCLQEGIEKEKCAEDSFSAYQYIRDWSKWALAICEKRGDIEGMLRYNRDLFQLSGGEMVYYTKLKSLVPPSQWKAYLHDLMNNTSFYDFYNDSNEAEIYMAEGEEDNLFQLLSSEKLSVDNVIRYAVHLSGEHLLSVLSVLSDRLKEYAEKNMGRHHYSYLSNMLKEMKNLKDGEEVVGQIVDEFRILYKRRRAMMDELKEL